MPPVENEGQDPPSEKTPVSEDVLEKELEAALERIVEGYRRGEREPIEEFMGKDSTLAHRILQIFPAIELLERVRNQGSGELPPGNPLSAGPAPRRGEAAMLGGFRLLRELGRGAMGAVYEAEDIALGRRVALKVLPFHSLMDPRLVERFRCEARAAGSLEHPNIVPVHAVHEEHGIHYYVMQLIEGASLDRVLLDLRALTGVGEAQDAAVVASSEGGMSTTLAQGLLAADSPGLDPRGDLDPSARAPEHRASDLRRARGLRRAFEHTVPPEYFRRVAGLTCQAAEALAVAHERGLVHRDVKPSNLILDAKGKLWLTDFGLAKAAEASGLTQSGDIVGTLRYLAPERLAGKCDGRSDIYSLGLTLYELLTLQAAFRAEDRDPLLAMILGEPPPPPRKLVAAVPGELEKIVLKAICKDPACRYQSSAELAADLRRFVAGEPVRARAPRLRRRSLPPVVRRSVLALAGLLLLILGGAFAAWWVTAPRPSKPSDLVLADLNGDGKLDIAVAASGEFKDDGPDTVSVFLNRGGGAFRSSAVRVGDYPKTVAAGDVDGDGDLDLLVCNQKSKALVVLRNDGRGGFAAAGEVRFEDHIMPFALADFDGDKSPDVALLVLHVNKVHVLKNAGRGDFKRQADYETGEGPDHVAAADLNGDGKPDLVTANVLGKTLSVLLNAGDGTFLPRTDCPTSEQVRYVATGDLNGDGAVDLVAPRYGVMGLSVLFNLGGGTFSGPRKQPLPSPADTVALGDLDGDGDLDIVAAGYLHHLCLVFNEGAGALAPAKTLNAGDRPAFVKLGDLNGDGALDIAVTNFGSGDVSVLLNGGKGSFEREERLPLAAGLFR